MSGVNRNVARERWRYERPPSVLNRIIHQAQAVLARAIESPEQKQARLLRERYERNQHLRRVGRSKYAPHQSAKERTKWARRFRTRHQPRGNGDQYVYASFPAAMAVMS